MLTDLSRDESKRLAAIDLLKNPDKGRDDALKKYTHLICQLLNMPMGFVSVLDEEKQYISPKCCRHGNQPERGILRTDPGTE